ncbi:histidine kinase [hydrothermal vent metagenome]|uniref:histidine kinase n=1 Tax=hydrothermal vent metagenome TaxID=652676 RepID=A0A1W1CCA9_9ZZZZ
MDLKKLKTFFIKNLLIITVIFPLIIILFYGISISVALKYKHDIYTKRELQRYEHELKNKHKNFLREKAKYIESFIDIIYEQETNSSKPLPTKSILKFIDSIKKYDSGFIFIFREDGIVIKHPCAETLINLVQTNNEKTILSRLIQASKDKKFINYRGTNCIDDNFINKIGIVYHIKTTDLYIVISKNEKDILYSIEQKKRVWEEKLDDELRENIKLLFILSLISIFFSIVFSKIINNLIKGYEKEIKDSNEIMFSQSRLAQAGELLSMISHQWRQPISKIASITSNMRFKIMMGKELEINHLDKKLNEVEEHTEFLSETIDDFREFYRPKKHKELEYILPLIYKALGFLEGQIHKKSINIQKEFDKDIEIFIYRNELIQVIINIVQNAIDFSKDKASIKIQTEIKEDEYIITITDNAGGIKEEYIDKIFDAHFSTKTSKESTNLGLGLYVSKVIIEKHFNGKLEVTSIDNSSTFTIRLVR